MDSQRRSSLAGGLVLILLGALFLAVQWVPGLQLWFSWPLIIIGIGVLLLIVGLLTGVPAMAIPACIVGGIGGLLYWQNATGNWESWAYAWALIPGFVGVGMVLSGLLGGDTRQTVRGGAWLILISLVLFAVFASFFGALGLVGRYWPVLLIGLGLLVLAQSLFRSR
jgi:hypothetical protein